MSASGMGLETKAKEYSGIIPAGQVTRVFTIREMLSTQVGKENPAEILKVEAKPMSQDCKTASADRASLKGELLVHILYKTEQGTLESSDYSVPISQMFELEQMPANGICMPQLNCISVDCSIDEDQEGKMLLEASIAATLRMFVPVEQDYVTDCYSVTHNTKIETQEMKMPMLVSTPNEKVAVTGEMSGPSGDFEIVDVTVNPTRDSYKLHGGRLEVVCQLNFNVLCYNEELGYQTVSGVVPATIPVNLFGYENNVEFSPMLNTISPTATIVGDNIKLSCDLILSGVVIGFNPHKIISDISIDENDLKTNRRNTAMLIYYAEQDENIWDIAKRYGAKANDIMAANSMQNEELTERTSLIIPL